MKKRFFVFLLILLTVVNGFLVFDLKIGQAADPTPNDKDDSYAQLKLFTRVVEVVRQHYVDGHKVSYRNLIYAALRGMLSELDPHSQFLEPAAFNDIRTSTQGEFGGIGIVITNKDGALVVVTPMEDGPGFKAGILPGDRILKIDGKTTDNLPLEEAVKKLKGQPGEKVTLTIFRPKSKEIQDVVLTREIIKVGSVKDINNGKNFSLAADGIGYIRITQFNEPTADELERALRKLEKQGMRGLILDLRNNPGGLLSSAVEVCSKFIEPNKIVVTTEGRDGRNRQEFRSRAEDKRRTCHMVVLINDGSASAAEIVAGCLKDYKRAVIVGETSFGKGSVQSVLPNQDGSAIRLTTAKYYTPAHVTIHEKGISPDIVVPVSEEEKHLLIMTRQALPESIEPGTTPKGFVDTQLNRAMDVLKGIAIFSDRADIGKDQPTSPTEKSARAPKHQ